MSKLKNIWVFSDAPNRLAEVMAGGLVLGEKVSVFVLGSSADVEQAFALGAHAVYHLGEKDSQQIIENYAETLTHVIAQSEAPALFLLAATRRGKALAAMVGFSLQAGVVNEASKISVETGGVVAQHMVYGGLALGEEKITSPVAVITIGNGVYEAVIADTARTGQAIAVPFIPPKVAIKCINRLPKEGVSSVDLGKAKRVVGIGRGVAKEEDIAMARDLCAAIDAELGCSRPIAEGEKWMERERYIGVSGVVLKPDVYFALGISGQIQHMVGAVGAQTIIAINKDKNAPIFQYADYGIVGDIYKVVPALAKALKG